MNFIYIFLMSVVGVNYSAASACTVVEIGTKENAATGQNLGWFWKIDAGLVVNKRNVAKFGLTPSASDIPAKWTSKYGSVSINPLGREFPLGGMNERGLSVQGLHSYDGRYETTSGLPMLNMFQWVQYQLDISATVEEAVANARAVRPSDNPQLTLHYLVCDSSGKCATFQWLKGSLEIRTELDLPVKAFTNTDYLTSLVAYQNCTSESCPLPNDGPNYSLQRFVRAARLQAAYDDKSDPVAYLFHLLDAVKQPQPLASWSIVTRNSGAIANTPFTVSVSAPGANEVQFVDLKEYDFSCETAAQMQIVDTTKAGNVRTHFKDYDLNLQKALVAGSKAPDAVQQRLIDYPEKTVCMSH